MLVKWLYSRCSVVRLVSNGDGEIGVMVVNWLLLA